MSRARTKKQETPARDVRPYWTERGYRPDLAALQPRPDEDPKGEEAYQRAFAEAAKADPPRLPNPVWYPNSESAQEYVRKRNSDFLLPRGSKRPGDEQSDAQQNARKLRDPDRSPALPTMKLKNDSDPVTKLNGHSNLPGPPSLSGPRMPGNVKTSPMSVGTPMTISQQPFTAPRLTVMEPSFGPSGPINKLR